MAVWLERGPKPQGEAEPPGKSARQEVLQLQAHDSTNPPSLPPTHIHNLGNNIELYMPQLEAEQCVQPTSLIMLS